ncbi:MAG: hypothetical protein QS98_C0013G0036 [archaeon GW2011_AR3]|nr:MAG: hypothetical protein QS98_C0013G0036 [archaeon GW2011_AR3]MBS3108981.1 hypothetical protein [Candidatus Woesearchaeota archaeon]
MKEKSAFLEREGYSPKNKVLDFLIIAQDFDYSLKDIAKYSKISYPCIKQLKKELVNDKWIFLTRKVGKAQMYKLNIKLSKVQKFIDFYWAVVNEEVENKLGIKNKETNASETYRSAAPISISARQC